MKSAFLDKLLDRLDRIDPGNLQNHFLRLANEKGLMETIFHAIQEGLIVIDSAGRISYVNRAAETMLGLPRDSAEGQHLSRHLRDVDWKQILELDEGEWAQMVSREIEIRYPRHRFLSFYVVPLTVVDERADGAVVILRDVTRDRQDHATMMESERLGAVMLLAAGVAHEIGNPLNSLTIHLQLLARELEEVEEPLRGRLLELVQVSRQEVSRLDQIINQFLGAVRPAAPAFERASLARVLQDTLVFLDPEIRDRDVLVEVDGTEGLPDVTIDPAQIRQVFFNIIRNAIQAMSGGGLLTIRMTSNERFAGVTFTDTGPGISPESIGHLFEPYHTTKEGGTGLGLMIVQRIVRDHGGEIEVRSEHGAGTTISVFLPLEERRIRMLQAPRRDREEDA
jgi:PAS domain S-box-containing protein